ncbi:MAG TPA: GTP cyclohydrolase II [Bryobacterales bacterium]|nr:GTP cyclohydrolase II [Bryobacterales bacterium]
MPSPSIRLAAEADFPCRFGHFRIYGFEAKAGGKSESVVALKLGELRDHGPAAPAKARPAPLVRIHSQCLTGDVFGSLRCDCRAQLEMSLERIAGEGRGLLLYEAQEGRGIGLINKLKAYQLQDAGADTVEANEQLGFEADLRTYRVAVAVLHHFGLRRVRLLSNNPGKIQALEEAGIQVAERVSCEVAPSSSTRDYLRTKKKKLGHLLRDL